MTAFFRLQHLRFISTLIVCFCGVASFAQKTELRARIGTGSFHYTGTNSVDRTFINRSKTLNIAYPNNPKGTESGFSYDAGLILMRATKYGLLYGIDAGFLSTQSRNSIYNVGGSPPDTGAATGNNYFRVNSVAFHPFAGYRIKLKKIAIDLTAGPEFARLQNANDRATVTIIQTGEQFKINRDYTATNTLGYRFQAALRYQRWGLDMGYSGGKWINDATTGGPIPITHTHYLRFGVSYRIY